MQIADADQSFVCSQCGKSYKTKGGLEKHEIDHSEVKRPHQCQICSEYLHIPECRARYINVCILFFVINLFPPEILPVLTNGNKVINDFTYFSDKGYFSKKHLVDHVRSHTGT